MVCPDHEGDIEYACGNIGIRSLSDSREHIGEVVLFASLLEVDERSHVDIIGIDLPALPHPIGKPDSEPAASGAYFTDHHSRLESHRIHNFFGRLPFVIFLFDRFSQIFGLRGGKSGYPCGKTQRDTEDANL